MIATDLLLFGAAVSCSCAPTPCARSGSPSSSRRRIFRSASRLLLALSISYALNAILPLRIGEVVRALFIAARLRLRLPYVLATVVAERYADLWAVALIGAVLSRLTKERRRRCSARRRCSPSPHV